MTWSEMEKLGASIQVLQQAVDLIKCPIHTARTTLILRNGELGVHSCCEDFAKVAHKAAMNAVNDAIVNAAKNKIRKAFS